ncbi:hypothetical protein HMPREF9374_3460 [Desmospora sp. 8437]|nr:hypothetical protein HMPREF9374_3460 [Desmospora sp. 8437]
MDKHGRVEQVWDTRNRVTSGRFSVAGFRMIGIGILQTLEGIK